MLRHTQKSGCARSLFPHASTRSADWGFGITGSSNSMKRFARLHTAGRIPARAKDLLRLSACWILTAHLAGTAGMPLLSAAADTSPSSEKPASKSAMDPVLQTMQAELARAKAD